MNESIKPRINKLDSEILSSTEQKYLQIQRDILYDKYLEGEFLRRYLQKNNTKLEKSWDEQLTTKNEEIKQITEEICKIENQITQAPIYTKLAKNLVFLNDYLTKQLENLNTKQVEQLLYQLQNICDKVYIEGLVVNKEDQNKLYVVITKLNDITNQIKETSNSDYCALFDKIRQINELSNQIGTQQNEVEKNLNKCNKLVLKVCSLKLSDKKEDEKFNCSNTI